ncbi:TetR/AcrR family transcriptional regulator [Jatrophihabitans sp. YIM 134969]
MTPRPAARKAAPEAAPDDGRTAAARERGGTVGTRRALVESQILEAATELFAARGFAGTSLQDIAEATGLTRPALYHYFSSKEDLLSQLVKEVTVGPATDLRRLRRSTSMSVSERLHAMAAAVAGLQARHPARFRMLVRSEGDLPEALATPYDAGRRSVLREFSSVIDEGVRSGEFRAVDPRTAALGIIGLCNWVAWWHRPGDEVEDQRVVASLADMALSSVVAHDRRPTAAGGLGRVVELLKQDLAALERLAATDGRD